MPLEVPHQERCSFCAYLAGERPYVILEQGPVVSILVTYEQRGEPHVLAIPSEHRETILDLQPDEGAALMDATIRCAAAIAAADDPTGIAVWQNNGIPAHQSVPHVHVHVAGTLAGGGTDWGPVPRITHEEAEAIADRLRPHLPPPP